MPEAATTATADHFSLQPLVPALRGLLPPQSVPDPHGAWSAQFALYTLAPRPSAQGKLTLSRTPNKTSVEFQTHYELHCGSKVMFLAHGRTRCATDALATPREWSVTTQQRDANDNTAALVSGRLRGAYDGRRIVLSEYGREETVEAPAALGWCWGLFDAVQRLAVNSEDGQTHRFTLLDHFDQIKPGHTLRLRKRCRVTLGTKLVVEEQATALEHGTVYRPQRVEHGGTAVDCVVFEQTGRGILPIVYWCTTDGCLLVVSSGLEAYVRQTGGKPNA